jgi:hypothetical protein
MSTSEEAQQLEQELQQQQMQQQMQQMQQMQAAAFPGLENLLSSGLTPEQMFALQHFQAMQNALPFMTPTGFPRPTVKRRKPVKWELWEEKNLIEGVRRVSVAHNDLHADLLRVVWTRQLGSDSRCL